MTSVEIRGSTVILRENQGRHQGCDGDELILRLTGPARGVVLYADKCAQEPLLGCDGHPWFMRDDVVRLPRGWSRHDPEALPLSDLEVISAQSASTAAR